MELDLQLGNMAAAATGGDGGSPLPVHTYIGGGSRTHCGVLHDQICYTPVAGTIVWCGVVHQSQAQYSVVQSRPPVAGTV